MKYASAPTTSNKALNSTIGNLDFLTAADHIAILIMLVIKVAQPGKVPFLTAIKTKELAVQMIP